MRSARVCGKLQDLTATAGWGMKMKFVIFVMAAFSLSLNAQQAVPSASSTTAVPRLVNFSGGTANAQGKVISGIAGVTFAMYKDQYEGAPLWLETQNVQADAKGHYTVQLGATKPEGLPLDLFTSGEAHWLGVRVNGGEEQPRVLLLSVPYALKAADAETVGGLPPSAFVLATTASGNAVGLSGTAASASFSDAPPASSNVTTTGGTVNALPLWTTATNVQSSALTQTGSGSTAKIGIGTTTPATTLDVKGSETVRGTLTLPATGTATATTGKNSQPIAWTASAFNSGTATAVNQVFRWQAEPVGNNTLTTSGLLDLLYSTGTGTPTSTGLNIASNGRITFASGQTFPGTGDGTVNSVGTGLGLSGGPITSSGILTINTAVVPQLNTANSFTGNQTVNGNVSATGLVTGSAYNIGSNLFAFGDYAKGNAFLGFAGNTTTAQGGNTASGYSALSSNTSGYLNTASGYGALLFNTSGFENTAIGSSALSSNTTGTDNTAIGINALFSNTTGSYNTAIGYTSGDELTSGDNNIYIGNQGLSSESNTIRIGTGSGGTNPHTAFYVAAVLGTTVTSGQQVYIGYDGRLGTVNSSRRYKDDIQDMGEASRGLLKLRPVTFRYKQLAPDGSKPLQYGLIAEEVAKVYPGAVGYDDAGQPNSVEYHKINAMLLNEVRRQAREIEELKVDLETRAMSLEDLKASLAELKALVQSQLGK